MADRLQGWIIIIAHIPLSQLHLTVFAPKWVSLSRFLEDYPVLRFLPKANDPNKLHNDDVGFSHPLCSNSPPDRHDIPLRDSILSRIYKRCC
jgi:hypothetical protein